MARGPSSLNLVTLLLVLGAAVLGYGAWKFFPVYWTAWQVDHALSEGAARAYVVSRVKGFEQLRARDQLVKSITAEVVRLGVTDPEMKLGLELTADRAYLTCDYRAVVVHPVGERYTVMTMHRVASGSLQTAPYNM